MDQSAELVRKVHKKNPTVVVEGLKAILGNARKHFPGAEAEIVAALEKRYPEAIAFAKAKKALP